MRGRGVTNNTKRPYAVAELAVAEVAWFLTVAGTLRGVVMAATAGDVVKVRDWHWARAFVTALVAWPERSIAFDGAARDTTAMIGQDRRDITRKE